MKLVATDRRMKGCEEFKFKIDFGNRREFIEVRQWFAETYGPAVELELRPWAQDHPLHNPRWSWEFGRDRRFGTTMRIYVSDQEVATFYRLRWEGSNNNDVPAWGG